MLTLSDGKWLKIIRDRMEKHFKRRNQTNFYILISYRCQKALHVRARPKNGRSGFCELVPTTVKDTEATVQALIDWFKRYGVVFFMVFGPRLTFQECDTEKTPKSHGCSKSFCNGTVEVINRQLSKVMRSLLSEKQQRIVNWHTLLPLCQSTIN